MEDQKLVSLQQKMQELVRANRDILTKNMEHNSTISEDDEWDDQDIWDELYEKLTKEDKKL